MEHLQFPIGRFVPQANYTVEEIAQLLRIMETQPAEYKTILANTTKQDLHKTYREGGWNITQLVHHVADIHLLNFLRFKKALTEPDYEATIIKMDEWATTPDATQAPVEDSLQMLEGITKRMLLLLNSLDEESLDISFYHPVRKINLSLKQVVYMATWHMAHHKAHIEIALGLPPTAFTFKV